MSLEGNVLVLQYLSIIVRRTIHQLYHNRAFGSMFSPIIFVVTTEPSYYLCFLKVQSNYLIAEIGRHAFCKHVFLLYLAE